jgi:glycosyltransferase involved in cell wall biosynthesis
MRVLVVCPVHDPRDARIAEREIPALLAAGHEVTQVGPFTAVGAVAQVGVRPIDIPRSAGRRRAHAVRETRRVLHEEAARHDIVLLHSADAVLAASGLRHPAIVWDLHEDTAASLMLKSWLPRPLRAPGARLARRFERRAARHRHLLLAETAYADRFDQPHPIVPNTPWVPESVLPSSRGRAVYVGSITVARGGEDLAHLGDALAGTAIEVEIIGPASGALAQRLRDAQRVRWRGFMANREALQRVQGATVGLSLLHDEINYRHSMPTKLLEYLAQGVPFVSTPLPLAVDLAERSGGGVIVPFGDVRAARDAVMGLNADDARRQAMADAGRAWVREHANWDIDGPVFVRQLEAWARR